ncbi:FAD-binding-3 domain-containing protein [Mycena sanguinolenta]|uniref:FAD-binding-3 domain-containing protein n=1 Tax=Mycena sanguinolenta TaxID=230812 RepID=A0A8H7CFT6_9AGAR|nr:FAD-binding-3 domain-containing protein [Mycena sanguinolenta]
MEDISSELQTWLDTQLGDKMNPLLDISGLDPSQDMPVELLHTILLGVIKYIWHHLNTAQWSDQDRHLLAIRLQSTDLTGLTVPPIRAGYMIQYKNNLIGKHFKTLMQILAFHVHGISMPEQFALIKAAGELGARLWVPEINKMDEYLDDLKIAIANLLDAFDQVDPLRILVKIKLHLLAHISDDIRRFGPLLRWATEIYESHNAVFRLCSVFSNRLAPSRDIAMKFASMDRVKHLLSGGYWWDPVLQQWTQAGRGVQQILLTDPIFQRHLGWTALPKVNPGFVKAMPAKRAPPVKWDQTKASAHWAMNTAPPSPDSSWRMGHAVTARSGDKAIIGSWVFGLDSKGATVIGRVAELLVGEKSLATVEQFICTDKLHPEFGWPVIRRPNGAEITNGQGQSHIVLDTTSLQFICSVQHDCRM